MHSLSSDFEETTGFQLLERSSKGVKLTPVGQLTMQHAIRLFQGIERFNAELRMHPSSP